MKHKTRTLSQVSADIRKAGVTLGNGYKVKSGTLTVSIPYSVATWDNGQFEIRDCQPLDMEEVYDSIKKKEGLKR